MDEDFNPVIVKYEKYMILNCRKGSEAFRALFFVAVFCISAIFSSSVMYANQNSAMEFNNTRIDGTLTSLVDKFKKDGCSVVGLTENEALLHGSFVAYGDCTIYINAESGIVKLVQIFLPDHLSWSSLYNNYLYMKQVMAMSYGMPTIDEETFSSPDIDDDMSRMDDLLVGGAKVRSVWNVSASSVSVSLDYSKGGGARVKIEYVIG